MFILFISAMLIFAAENRKGTQNLLMLIFEQISAYSTCGLTMGVTSSITTFSKLVLIMDMYLGRIGAFTFFMSFARSNRETSKIKYPEANINV